MEAFGRTRKRKPPVVPITGLSLFAAEKKQALREAHPELTKLAVFALLNYEWDTLDDATRSLYQRKADYSRRTKLRCSRKTDNDNKAAKISGYAIFVAERHDALKRTNPELTVGGRAKIIAAEWNSMDRDHKIGYTNAAKRETRRLSKRNSDDESEKGSGSDDEMK